MYIKKINYFLSLTSLIFSCSVIISYTFAKDVLPIVYNLLPKNPTILEAGAHKGEDTIRFSKFWPHGAIYCFEPLPANITDIKEVIKEYNNIILFPLALSNVNGQAKFYVNQVNSGAGTLHKPGSGNFPEYAQEAITVECTTPGEWAHKNNIDHIDFMWLDMEGHELFMLKAIPYDLLKTITAIYTEVNKGMWWQGIPLYPEIKEWMEQHKFRVIWEDDWGRSANVLFVRSQD